MLLMSSTLIIVILFPGGMVVLVRGGSHKDTMGKARFQWQMLKNAGGRNQNCNCFGRSGGCRWDSGWEET
jgi:hypothetical protein